MRSRWNIRILAVVACSGLLLGAVSAIRAGLVPPLTVPPSRTPSHERPREEPPASARHIRILAYRWPAPVNGPEVDLAPVIEAVRESHPGIEVEVVTLSYQACLDMLTQALQSGDPPDIFVPPPGELAVYDAALQVDLKQSLPRHEIDSYLPEAVAACTRDQKLLALPRWVEGRAWVANNRALRSIGFDPGRTMSSWTWREFESTCEQIKAKGFVPVIVDPSSPEMMSDLGYEPPRDSKGDPRGEPSPPASPGASLPRVLSSAPAEMARSLIRRGLAGAQIVGSADSNALESLAAGDVGFVAGLSPILASEVLARFTSKSFTPVLIPVPTSGLLRGPSLRAGGIIVFKQRQYKGNWHTRVVVDLARALSTARWNSALPVLMTPAYRSNLGDWTGTHGWNAVVALASVQRSNPEPLLHQVELRMRQQSREKARTELRRGFKRLE